MEDSGIIFDALMEKIVEYLKNPYKGKLIGEAELREYEIGEEEISKL